MLLRFVAGRAGSGKSTWVYEAVRRDLGKSALPVYVVVPEQFTLQTEKELIAALETKGLMQARVSSPSRLAEEVFSQVEQDRRAAIGECGLAMALRAAASGIEGELQAFRSVLGYSGFSVGMVRLISELKQFDVAPEDMLTASAGAKGALKAKAADIAAIYRAYDRYLSERSYMDGDDRFNGFIMSIGKAAFLKGCTFYFDGFDHLSPQHCRMIGELLIIADAVTVTQDYDGLESADSDLFRAAQGNIARLTGIAKEVGAEIKWEHIRTDERECAMPPDVAHLERSLFNWDAKPIQARGGVTLCRAADMEEEAEAAAAWIVRKAREEGLRWREIAVQCGDLASYAPVVSRIFGGYGIPCFIDSRKAVLGHPAVRFLLSLAKLLQRDFRADDALRLVKTGCAGISAEAADELEVYLMAFAPRGMKAWARDWTKGQDAYDLKKLNESRRTVHSLAHRLAQYTGGKTASGGVWAKALFALLEEMKLDEMLDAQALALKRAGLLEEAAVTERVWNAVMDLLDQLNEIIGAETLDAAGFAAILQSGFESVEEGIIPTGVDQVQVGSIGRSKHSGLRHMLILGASDGSLSQGAETGGILSARDVDALAPLGVEAGRGSALRASQRRFALYEAVTKGSSGLYISWPASDAAGAESKPDRIVERAMALLELGEGDVLDARAVIDSPSCGQGALGRLPEMLRGAMRETGRDEEKAGLLKWFLCSEEFGERTRSLLQTVTGERPVEYLRAAGAVFGAAPALTASELETYGDCPFRHFVEFALRPSQWREHGVEGADAGKFLHEAMERLGRRLAALRRDADAFGDERVAKLMAREAESLAAEFDYGLLESSAKLMWTGGNLRKICATAASTFARQLRCGAFLPYGQELRIGRGSLPSLPLPLPDGSTAYLQGRVDRVDVCRADDEDWLRVVDYKSGKASIDVYAAVNGLDIQTWLYMHALRSLWQKASGRPGRAAGAYIFPLANPWVEEGADEEKKRRDELKLRGWCLRDAKVMAAMDSAAAGNRSELYNFSARNGGLYDEAVVAAALGLVADNAGGAASEMRRGHIAALPWRSGRETACDGCAYGALCRFKARESKKYRQLLDGGAVDEKLGLKKEAGSVAVDE